MKPMVLKHAYLPDALTAGLRERYDLREFSQMSDADFVAIAGDITS
ncbi:hypothetical protein QCE80_17260 [Staphylococcus aureus]|nr:hypothetical protein [Staphylococcus aureus]